MEGLNGLAVERLGLDRSILDGQVAVISGAGRGIGREVARALAWLGARVVIAEISESGLDTEHQIQQDGGQALYVRTDVARETDIVYLAKRTEDAYGPATILVNNAILCPTASVLEMDVDQWDRVMNVNLRGTFLMCKAFLPHMLAHGKGTIVNMISTDAMPYLSAYIASKQGIAAFSKSLAGEVGQNGVRVIALAPGFVDTPGLRNAAQGLSPHMGLSEEEFMKLNFHPAYEKAMPPDHAAAATAYLVAVLTEEFHGEQVTGYTILERAGFLRKPEVKEIEPEPEPEISPVVEPAVDRVAALEHAMMFSSDLMEILKETESELDKLPIFVRPMARQGFKGKAGITLQDWSRTLEHLVSRLQQLETDNPVLGPAFRKDYPRLKESFADLMVYYRETPDETARFTRDPELLEEVRQIAARRVETIQSLQAELDILAGG